MRWEKGAGRMPYRDSTSSIVVPFTPQERKVSQPDRAEWYQAPRIQLCQWVSLIARWKVKKGGRNWEERACQPFSVAFVKTLDKVWKSASANTCTTQVLRDLKRRDIHSMERTYANQSEVWKKRHIGLWGFSWKTCATYRPLLQFHQRLNSLCSPLPKAVYLLQER